MKKYLKKFNDIPLLMVMAVAVYVAPALAQVKTTEGDRFLEVSYGVAPGGSVKSNSFSDFGYGDLSAVIQYDSSQLSSIEYGIRKLGWGILDISLSASKVITPIANINIPAVSYSSDLSRNSPINLYSINAYHRFMNGQNYDLFAGFGVGVVNFSDNDTRGVSGSITLGGRYELGKNIYGVINYKLIVIPESIFQHDQLTSAIKISKTLMPVMNLGIGFNF